MGLKLIYGLRLEFENELGPIKGGKQSQKIWENSKQRNGIITVP